MPTSRRHTRSSSTCGQLRGATSPALSSGSTSPTPPGTSRRLCSTSDRSSCDNRATTRRSAVVTTRLPHDDEAADCLALLHLLEGCGYLLEAQLAAHGWRDHAGADQLQQLR